MTNNQLLNLLIVLKKRLQEGNVSANYANAIAVKSAQDALGWLHAMAHEASDAEAILNGKKELEKAIAINDTPRSKTDPFFVYRLVETAIYNVVETLSQ